MYMALFGWSDAHGEMYLDNMKAVKENARILNSHIEGKEFFVGSHLTLADVFVACAVRLSFEVLFEANYRKAIPHLTKWFENIITMTEFKGRWGNVKLCAKVMKPLVQPKAAKAEPKKKAVAAAPVVQKEKEKKEENPLDCLPPSTFDLIEFKNTFVNSKDRKGEGMKYFFDNYENEGYTVYFVHYEMYDGEGEKLY